MKLTNNFSMEEFIPKHIWLKYGDKGMWFVDWEMVMFAQAFREVVGKSVTINDWHTGGKFNGSGFRDELIPEYRSHSQHSFKAALDLKVSGMSGHELVQILKDHRDKWPQITTYENPDKTETWLHADKRHTGMSELFMVNPA